MIVPTTFFKMEVVSNGVDSGMQVKHEKKGREYPVVYPGTKFHYTKGSLPALKATATARKARFSGQVVLEVALTLETLLEVLLKTSCVVRHSTKCQNVEAFITNFSPLSSGQGQDMPSRTQLYVAGTKHVPLSSFPLDRECQVYIYPSTLSFNKEKRLLKCRLCAVPLSFLADSSCVARVFQEDHDASMEIPSSKMLLLGEGFLKKWRNTRDLDESDDDAEDGDDDDIFA